MYIGTYNIRGNAVLGYTYIIDAKILLVYFTVKGGCYWTKLLYKDT